MGGWKQVMVGAVAAAAVGFAGLGVGTLAQAQATDAAPHPGKAVYDQFCAACHDIPEEGGRTPPVASLRRMNAQVLMAALTTGVMKPIGDGLDRRQMRDVVAYLAPPEAPVGTAWIDGNMCVADQRAVDLSAGPAQVGFGVDTDNSRRMTARQAGLSARDAANLEVAWAFAMPKTSGLRGQGVVVGSTLFYPAGQAGYLLALDTRTGCVKWATPTPSNLRGSLAYGKLGPKGPWGLVGGDASGHLSAFDAASGKVVWRADPRHDKSVPLSGTPLFAGARIVVPISSGDVGAAMRPTHPLLQVAWRGSGGGRGVRQTAVDLAHHGGRQAAQPQEFRRRRPVRPVRRADLVQPVGRSEKGRGLRLNRGKHLAAGHGDQRRAGGA